MKRQSVLRPGAEMDDIEAAFWAKSVEISRAQFADLPDVLDILEAEWRASGILVDQEQDHGSIDPDRPRAD